MNSVRRFLLGPLLAALLLLPAGCAKSPGGGATSPVSGPQLIVTMTVAGNINPNYYYYVLFNVNRAKGPDGSSMGPVPVVVSADSTGNGYAAGAFTNYVKYKGGQPGGTDFSYYVVDKTLFNSEALTGRLIQQQAVGNTLRFQLPLASLATTNVAVDGINNLQVNFIATNVVPVPGQSLGTPKYFDALYPPQQAGNSYVTLNIRSGITVLPNIFTNTSLGVNEKAGDVGTQGNGGVVQVSRPDSGKLSDGVSQNAINYDDLDITDWTIQLTAGS